MLYPWSTMYTISATDGQLISSYLAAMKMAVAPTSWSLPRDTILHDRKRSM